MDSLKKKHTELLALYKLEREVRDLYVEGNKDKDFYGHYLKSKKDGRKIIPVDIVDFTGISDVYVKGLDTRSNRNKIIILTKYLVANLPLTKVKGIIDKDFDDFIVSERNLLLLRTDFSSVESYLFSNEVLDKFLSVGIGNFPFDAAHVLRELTKVLKPLFCLRLLREQKFKEAQLLTIDGILNISKQNGVSAPFFKQLLLE